MANRVRVCFTQNIQRHVACPPTEVEAATVREALEAVFSGNPVARGYVLDDQGACRKHIAIFLNGQQIADRQRLSDEAPSGAEIWVMQALSGG